MADDGTERGRVVNDGAGRPLTVLLVVERARTPTFLAELTRSERYRAVGRTETIAMAVEAATRVRPDVVLADVVDADQIRDLAKLRGEVDAKVVVVSGLAPELVLVPALAAGARAFVCKPIEEGLLSQALEAVTAGHAFVDPRAAGWLVELALNGRLAKNEAGLTLRQSQIVQLVLAGLTNRQIARTLGLSNDTVKSHLRAAMRLLGAHSRRDVVAWYAARQVQWPSR